MKSKTAIFPGSFNPFTRGHADIVARGLGLFDRIVIAIGWTLRRLPKPFAASTPIIRPSRLWYILASRCSSQGRSAPVSFSVEYAR